MTPLPELMATGIKYIIYGGLALLILAVVIFIIYKALEGFGVI